MKTKILFLLFFIPLPLYSQWIQTSNGSNSYYVNLDSSVYKVVNVLIKSWPAYNSTDQTTPALPVKIYIDFGQDINKSFEAKVVNAFSARTQGRSTKSFSAVNLKSPMDVLNYFMNKGWKIYNYSETSNYTNTLPPGSKNTTEQECRILLIK
jgi:hypothetical protein